MYAEIKSSTFYGGLWVLQ